MSFADQVVMITGGARGIGAETGKALAARGAKVVLTDLDREALEETVAEIGSQSALGLVADVCDFAAMETAVKEALARFGKLDAVVANAGIASYGSIANTDPETFKRVIDINITGVFHTVRAALPAITEAKGYILVVSSLAAFTAAPGLGAYNASKAGVEHFANALRLEMKHQGVDVGCAHMSWIDTPLVRDVKEDLPTFNEFLAKLPPPMGKTTTVDACVKAFVKGIEKRQTHIYVPGWVRGMALNRVAINSRITGSVISRQVGDLLSRMDAEVAALGRSTSSRNIANREAATKPTTGKTTAKKAAKKAAQTKKKA